MKTGIDIRALSNHLCAGNGILAHLSKKQGLYSLSRKASYQQISWSLEAAGLDGIKTISNGNLTGSSATLAAVEVPVKFQSDGKSLNPNLGASRRREILR